MSEHQTITVFTVFALIPEKKNFRILIVSVFFGIAKNGNPVYVPAKYQYWG